MSLEIYLQNHFVDKATFVSLAGISIDRLDQLIAAKAVPTATYTCNGNSIYSTVFGDTSIKESLSGEYFRPECVKWVKIAHKAHSGAERQAVLSQLIKELSSSLEEHHTSKATIEETIQGYLPYFFNGTFGLCVADPATGAGIVRKEMLQARLIELTANGCIPTPANISKEELLKLIDDYASSSMPFSPAEYERSSKKRLVDDLRLLVVKA